jgi:hypothetical protein
MTRYYVQRLTDTCFLIRERQIGTEPNAEDRIVRIFTDREDAHAYAAVMNDVQCQLDQLSGYGQVPAV